MKHINLHLPSTPLHSPSKPKPKASPPSPIDVALLPVPAAGMQVKGVRTIVRRFRGAIQIVARSKHHQSPAIAALVPAPPPPPTAAAPDPFEAFVPPVVAVDLVLSPKHSSDSLASSSHSASSSHPTQPPAARHRSSSTFSSSPSSVFETAADHSSSCDRSLEAQANMSDDASPYTSAVPEGESIDLPESSRGSVHDASTVASSENLARPTQYPDHEEEEQDEDDDSDDSEETPQRADSSALGDDERSSTLDEPQFGTSDQSADSTDFAAETPEARDSPESEAPDPFLEDVPEDSPTSEVPPEELAEEQPAGGLSVDETAQSLAAAEEVALAQSPPPTAPTEVPNTAFDLNKAVPPPPPAAAAEEDDEDEEDSPELYLPGLVLPTMFLPIPNVGSLSFSMLTWWLPGRHVYYPCTIRRTH